MIAIRIFLKLKIQHDALHLFISTKKLLIVFPSLRFNKAAHRYRRLKMTFCPFTEHPLLASDLTFVTTHMRFIRLRMKLEITERLPLVRHNQPQHYMWFDILPNHTNGFRNMISDKRVNELVSCTAIVSRQVEPALWGKNNSII
jgi:hypothetical protein